MDGHWRIESQYQTSITSFHPPILQNSGTVERTDLENKCSRVTRKTHFQVGIDINQLKQGTLIKIREGKECLGMSGGVELFI